MKNLIFEMADLFTRKESFVLATVITRSGSAPRSAGAKMLVRADGSNSGTVGGGILEAQVEQIARETFKSHTAVVRDFHFSGRDAATMDAICGGEVEVLVEWLDAEDASLEVVIAALKAAVMERRKAWLVTGLPGEGAEPCHGLIQLDGVVVGSLPPGLSPEAVIETRQAWIYSVGEMRAAVEPIEISGTVYIFGAGHVSRSLAEFTRAVGFWTVVLDDRPDYACVERFPDANELIVLGSFDEAFGKIQVDEDSFIVIVTRGHLNDRTVLAQALKTRAAYVGMIGSRRKCALVFEQLRIEGFSDTDIQRVHAPIGLPIDAETPEEIGISIVGEMIQVRAGLNR